MWKDYEESYSKFVDFTGFLHSLGVIGDWTWSEFHVFIYKAAAGFEARKKTLDEIKKNKENF